MLNVLVVYTKNDKAIDVVKNSLRKRLKKQEILNLL